MYHDSADTACLAQAHVLPGLSAVVGFVYAVTYRDAAADIGFAGTRPDYVRVRRRDSDSADRCNVLIVEDGMPAEATIIGFPQSSRCGTDVVDFRIAWYTCRSNRPIAFGTDMSEGQILEVAQ
jgi:hypothetical protein